MQYNEFAYIYDKLMKPDVNYNRIADFIENIFIRYDKNPVLIADLACGTGNITVPMAKRGYEMIGVDISEEMLSVAREKAMSENADILFLKQDISKLDLYGTCDAFLCMIDGLNYIIEPKKIEHLFKRIKSCFLNPGGVLIFDVSTPYKLGTVIGDNTFVYDTDEVFYSWENKFIEKYSLSKMYLNFFCKEKNGGYKRFYEEHLQRGHSVKELKSALKKAGFTKIEIFSGFGFEEVNEFSERIVFAVQ